MTAMDRLAAEQHFHDAQARARAAWFAEHAHQLRFTDGDYLDHESWIRSAFAQLGEVRGLDVLDYGCGHGMAAIVLARAGACVTGFDLSHGYIAEARARAAANEVYVSVLQADAERLPFADQSFDRVWGNAILHHLDIVPAAEELYRVLRPGGVAVFCEPWGENALVRWARSRGSHRHTRDELPLRRRQLHELRLVFPDVSIRGFQLLSMARRALPSRRLVSGLDRCDTALLDQVPRLQRYCRYVLLTMQKSVATVTTAPKHAPHANRRSERKP